MAADAIAAEQAAAAAGDARGLPLLGGVAVGGASGTATPFGTAGVAIGSGLNTAGAGGVLVASSASSNSLAGSVLSASGGQLVSGGSLTGTSVSGGALTGATVSGGSLSGGSLGVSEGLLTSGGYVAVQNANGAISYVPLGYSGITRGSSRLCGSSSGVYYCK